MCHLLAGRQYQAHVQVVSRDGKLDKTSETVFETISSGTIFMTPKRIKLMSLFLFSGSLGYDKTTVGLIVVITLLVLALLFVGFFVTRPWIQRYKLNIDSISITMDHLFSLKH